MHIDNLAIVLGFAICTSAAPWGGPGDQEHCSDIVISSPSTIGATPSAFRWNRCGHMHYSEDGASPSARSSSSEAGPMNTPQPTPAPAPETITIQSPPPAQSPDPTQATPTTATSNDAAPTDATPSQSTPVSTDMPIVAPADGGTLGDYIVIVNQFRNAAGLPLLAQDSTLEANAAKTCADSGGQLKHELNPGSFAQVLAEGAKDNNFWSTYVGGWLCEMPNLPYLSGVCITAANGWAHNGDTGHAVILTDKVYTRIGCAIGSGLWACDLA